jgi:uncharacterized protein YndB with AHSA1/START domain
MSRFTMSEHVAQPPGRVWDTVMDVSNAPRWRALTRSMVLIGDGPPRVGARYRLEMEAGGKRLVRESEIVALEPGRRITLQSGSDGYSARFDYDMAPEDNGTRLTFTVEMTADSLWKRLLLPLIMRSERLARSAQLGKLKRLVEAGP